MKLDLFYDFANALGPGWTMTFQVRERYAAVFFNHEPTVKEVIEFVNSCGEQLEEAA